MKALLSIGVFGITFLFLAVRPYYDLPFDLSLVLDGSISPSYYGSGILDSLNWFLDLYNGIVSALESVIDFFTGDWWPL
jgi:hypothetical protein